MSKAWIWLVPCIGAVACSPADDEGSTEGGGRRDDGGGEAAADADDDAAAEAEAAADSDDGGVEDVVWDNVCDEMDFVIAMEPVRVMILLDESSSMSSALGWGRSHWEEATEGLNHLLSDPVSRNFIYGLDAFPDGTPEYFEGCYDECCADPVCLMTRAIYCMGFSARCDRSCTTDLAPIVELAPSAESGPLISDYMALPYLPGTFTLTPLLRQMQWYRDTGPSVIPDFYADDGNSYIVVVSDGEDTCDAEGDPPDPAPVISGLVAATTSIRTTHGIKSFAIGFGDTSGSMADELNAIAANGGSAFTTFFPIDDPTAIIDAFDSISSEIVSCVYDVGEPSATSDPDAVNFYFDGDVVGYDDTCTDGWRWADAEHLRVEFCGATCDALKAGEVASIQARFGCATILW
ncbi:MAG: hypothetical protein HY905_26160 [Deltaproteobacteria bacterium]|nr:hypothetical protein [Deltaproteobacteria bacterium]